MRSTFEGWIETLRAVQGRRYYRDQTPESLAVLVRLAERFMPTRIVELGTHWGLSLRAWVYANTAAEIVSVDWGGMKGVQLGYEACPFDLSRVRPIKADVRDLVSADLWGPDDRVLLYCDLHGAGAMAHILTELIPNLPLASLVVVDDVWPSQFDFIDQAGFERFFEQAIAPDVDPEQPDNRPRWWGRYWATGRPVGGFAEIEGLMAYVNQHRLDCRFEAKTMWFYTGFEPMTIFTTCKPFYGQTRTIQENALRSWADLQPRPEIIVLGDDYGAAGVAQALNIRHEPELSPMTHPPRVDVIFETGQRMASHDLMAYVNADIVLDPRFILAAQRAANAFDGPFLMTGLRWDLMDWEGLEVGGPDWWGDWLLHNAEAGQFHPCTGADYFIFLKGLYPHIPRFYIGRSAWDNWLIMDVVRRGLPVVDATPFIHAIHHGLERCDIADPLYLHNQAIWKVYRPQHGEGTIETANWCLCADGVVAETGMKIA